MGILDVLNKKNLVEPKSEQTPQETTEELSIEEKVRNFRMKNTYSAQEEQPSPIEQEIMDIFEEKGTQVSIMSPRSYDHVPSISREIKAGKIVILKLGRVNNENEAVRIIEFIFGMCDALEIEPKLVDDTIYMINNSGIR